MMKKTFGNSSISRLPSLLYNREREEIEHNAEKILIGKLYRTVELKVDSGKLCVSYAENSKERDFYLDMEHSAHICLFAQTGGGKTFIITRAAASFYLSGKGVFFISDIKDEMKSIANPRLKKYDAYVPVKNEFTEKSTGIPVAVLRPPYLNEAEGIKMPKDEIDSRMYLPTMTATTLLSICGISQGNEDKTGMTSILIDTLEQELKKGNIKTTADLEAFFTDEEKTKGYNKNTKESIRLKLKNAITKGVITDNPAYNRSIAEYLNNKIVPILNLKGYRDAGFNSAGVEVATRIGEIRSGRTNNKIKDKLLMVIDEAHAFCPENEKEQSISRKAIIDLIRIARSMGISMAFLSQIDEKSFGIPPLIVKQCRYVFLSSNTSIQILRKVLRLFNMYTYDNSKEDFGISPESTFVEYVFNGARKVWDAKTKPRTPWYVIDSKTSTISLVWIYSPPCAVPEEM